MSLRNLFSHVVETVKEYEGPAYAVGGMVTMASMMGGSPVLPAAGSSVGMAAACMAAQFGVGFLAARTGMAVCMQRWDDEDKGMKPPRL